jgi:hypothetical protein
MNHLRGQGADLGILEAEVANEEGARRDVDDGARNSLV